MSNKALFVETMEVKIIIAEKAEGQSRNVIIIGEVKS